MKKPIILIFVLILSSGVLFAQNFLAPIWKISFSDTSTKLQNNSNIDGWNDVNLLLSWERQGYYWNSGKCCLAIKFVVPEK